MLSKNLLHDYIPSFPGWGPITGHSFLKVCSLSRNSWSDHRVGLTQLMYLLCNFCKRAWLSNRGTLQLLESYLDNALLFETSTIFLLILQGQHPCLHPYKCTVRHLLSYTGEILMIKIYTVPYVIIFRGTDITLQFSVCTKWYRYILLLHWCTQRSTNSNWQQME